MIRIKEAQDALTGAKSCIDCVFLATEGLGLGQEQSGAIQHVADIASRKIDEAIALLKDYRGSVGSRVPE
jgi:hypothetical protein